MHIAKVNLYSLGLRSYHSLFNTQQNDNFGLWSLQPNWLISNLKQVLRKEKSYHRFVRLKLKLYWISFDCIYIQMCITSTFCFATKWNYNSKNLSITTKMQIFKIFQNLTKLIALLWGSSRSYISLYLMRTEYETWCVPSSGADGW